MSHLVIFRIETQRKAKQYDRKRHENLLMMRGIKKGRNTNDNINSKKNKKKNFILLNADDEKEA